jgi:pyruvate/2-oxoglutarate dehydrogenase complex dihydrolipoamide acyltransferase (E2) component
MRLVIGAMQPDPANVVIAVQETASGLDLTLTWHDRPIDQAAAHAFLSYLAGALSDVRRMIL